MSEINISQVHFSYGTKQVLSGLDMTIPQGMYGLLGRNGAGKTTLMKLIVGLLPLSDGQIRVNGIPVSRPRQLRTQIGYLPQHFDFYPGMTVEKVLEYLGVLDKIAPSRLKSQIDKLLDIVNLTAQRRSQVRHLSGGMKRRLGIAQSLLNDPPVLIVDEPTAGLDPEERIRFRNLLVNLAESKTIVLSTHIASDLESSCPLLGILDQGRLLYQGKIDQLLRQTDQVTYQTTIPTDQLSQFKKRYLIYEQKPVEDGWEIKLLCHGLPEAGFVRIKPNLEAAYLNQIHYGGDTA